MVDSKAVRLASYSRVSFGAAVPVTEHDFGCGDELLGGELSCKGKLDPAREIV
jgi:hypothetical protein